MEVLDEAIRKVWNTLRFGETVLIEHVSTTSPALGLYHLTSWARDRGYRVVIDDILDTLHLYRTHLKAMGMDTSVIDGATVIKEGGTINVGQVKRRISLKEVSIRKSEYSQVYEPLLEDGNVISPVLGIGKLFLISESKREALSLLNSILASTGDERRIMFYFLNVDLINTCCPYVLPLLEELATTVISLNKEGRSVKLMIRKSVNNRIDGIEITLR
ncbi:hypothetical protein E3E36_02640 [Thermococcus sp. M36]|nr:hypothetical protein [Thermococcus sp. M36]